ncbi:phospholipase D-like domain-containing protein [Hydrogenophaga sp.]|uniref:phospholipase D-like domain-containing protein n=1 Tax=Hydrogenophaga sp. TaxID=1904254 RepID=UPI0025B9723B|nr:phospholipase D-like domain-containing protein [Hydrogenophaga sp.]
MNFPDGSVKAIADPAGMSGSPIWLQQGDELKCAGNNRDKNFTSHKVQVRMQQLEHSINRYLTELDRADRDPTIVLPDRVARLKEKISKIKEQMRGLGEIEAHLQSSQERQVSFTDPDARSMATSRLGSAVVGYNVQTAVDAKHHLIVAHEVTNAVTDRGQLAAMAMAAKEATAHPSLIVLADRGYFEGYQILECEQAGIATMVPKALTSGGKFEGRFDKRDFIYDKERDEYRCPAGQKAIRRFTTVEDGKTLNKYWSSSCPGCHLKEQCTPAPYRRISRWEHEDVLEVVQARLDGAPAASRLRQSIHVLAYAFQAPDIMQALVDAKNRGVEVRVVVDKKRNRGKTSRKAMDFVTRHGVELRTNDHFHIHHDKTIIVDGHTVQTGSFNFAPSAETLNSENVVVIRGLPEVSSQYMAHWQSRWKLGKPYPAQP